MAGLYNGRPFYVLGPPVCKHLSFVFDRYQCTEKEVMVYYKVFPSATRHGFLGAGVIERPLPCVWGLVRDPGKRHLYDRTINTARIHKKVTSHIQLGEYQHKPLPTITVVYSLGSGCQPGRNLEASYFISSGLNKQFHFLIFARFFQSKDSIKQILLQKYN